MSTTANKGSIYPGIGSRATWSGGSYLLVATLYCVDHATRRSFLKIKKIRRNCGVLTVYSAVVRYCCRGSYIHNAQEHGSNVVIIIIPIINNDNSSNSCINIGIRNSTISRILSVALFVDVRSKSFSNGRRRRIFDENTDKNAVSFDTLIDVTYIIFEFALQRASVLFLFVSHTQFSQFISPAGGAEGHIVAALLSRAVFY